MSARQTGLAGRLEVGDGQALNDPSAPLPDGIAAKDFTIWQLIDSAFPTGGFAHSSGLEAAWQQGEIRNREDLQSYLIASIDQAGHGGLPFVLASHLEPHRLKEFDALCDAFTRNHVANRASRAQGRAFWTAVNKVFGTSERDSVRDPVGSADLSIWDSPIPPPDYAHWAPVFGAVARRLTFDGETTGRIFLFSHLRGALGAAVRLNVIGPMEGQVFLHRLAPELEAMRERCSDLTLGDLAQTAPLLDLWQGTQDRLYTRLFQS